MATVDRERYNLLYKPDLHPVRDWRSEATFEEPDIPVGAIVPEETIDDVLQDLKDLEEVSMGLPDGLDPVNEIVTKLRQRAEILKVEEELLPFVPKEPPTISPYVPTPGTTTTVSPYVPIPETPGTGTPGTPTTGTPVTLPPYTPTPETPPIYREPDTIPGAPVIYPPVEPIPYSPTVIEVEPEEPTYHKDTVREPGTIIIPEQEPHVNVGSNVITETPDIEGTPTSFVPTTNITLSVETPKTLVQIAQESYKKDQIDLQKFYLEKMRMALQRYFHHLLSLTAELSLTDPDMLTKKYDGKYVTGISANLQHLHDTIIRSQIQRLQKARVFKKIANTDQTVTHMRAWHAAEKERERYYEEAYGNSDTFVNSESNALLRQARSDYDAAYKLSLYNMYKYLDSSVKVTEDILDHTLTEAKAKAKLIKEGVDIFKTEEVTITTQTNAVQKLQPKTQAQVDAEAKAEREAEKNKNASLTPEDIDKARNVQDPDKDFDLAPSGGHYSKNDIDYLCNMDAKIYNRDTPEGRANIKAALNSSDKYMAATQDEDKKSDTPVNKDEGTATVSGGDDGSASTVKSGSDSKVEDTTGEPVSPQPRETSDDSDLRTVHKNDNYNRGNYSVSISYSAYERKQESNVLGNKDTKTFWSSRVAVTIKDSSTYIIVVAWSVKDKIPNKTLAELKAMRNIAALNPVIEEAFTKSTAEFWK